MEKLADTKWEFMDLLSETIKKMEAILKKEQGGDRDDSEAYKVSLSEKSKETKAKL